MPVPLSGAEASLAAKASGQPAPIQKDPGLTPEAFKQRLLKAHPDAVSNDGTKYADIPAEQLVQSAVNAHPDGVTGDGHKYSDFLPPPPPAPVEKPVNPAIEVAKGFAKGAGQDVLGAAQFGENVANQTAGRLINLVGGKGFKPLSSEQLGDASTANADSPSMKAANEALKSENKYQTAGKIGEFGASILLPSGLATDALEAAKAAKSMRAATAIAGPKNTIKTAEALLSSTSQDPLRAQKGAEVIDQMVKKGLLKAGDDAKTATRNAEALKTEISSTAEGLVNELKSMDVKPILQRGDLEGVFKDTMAKIEENPYLDESAAKSAKKMFDLFYSKLPKGTDISAEDVLQARKDFDAAVKGMKPNAFDPKTENATSLALRAIRQNLNDLIIKKAPGVKVEAALKRQTALYDVLENVAEKGAPALKKAIEVASMPGWQGVAARHPLLTGVLGSAGGALLTGLGISEGSKVRGLLGQ